MKSHRPRPTIEARQLSKWFGSVVALSELTFDVGPGVTALLGPNGAGKSTLFRVLCGLANPSQGTVRIFGEDPRANPALTRRIGIAPQQERLFERQTIVEFVGLAATLHRLSDPGGRGPRAIETVELDPGDRRPLGAYSKGMRQRVKLAQAIVNDPDLLVLDEPLEGLDPRQRLRSIDLFRRLGDQGKTVIVSSHVLDEVERFGSRILVITQGRLMAEGPFSAIRGAHGRPASPPPGRHRPARGAGGRPADQRGGHRRPGQRRLDRGGDQRRPRLSPLGRGRGPRLRCPADRGARPRRRPRKRLRLSGRPPMTDGSRPLDRQSRCGGGGPLHRHPRPGGRARPARAGRRRPRPRQCHLAQPANRPDAAWSLVDSYGLSLLVPVVVPGVRHPPRSATWPRTAPWSTCGCGPCPAGSWPSPPFAASVTVVGPVAVLPLAVGTALSGQGARLVGAAAAGGMLATVAYSAVFCGLGLRVRRALAWGLAYLLIWEQAVARVSHGAARASLFISSPIGGRPPGGPTAAPQRRGLGAPG